MTQSFKRCFLVLIWFSCFHVYECGQALAAETTLSMELQWALLPPNLETLWLINWEW